METKEKIFLMLLILSLISWILIFFVPPLPMAIIFLCFYIAAYILGVKIIKEGK